MIKFLPSNNKNQSENVYYVTVIIPSHNRHSLAAKVASIFGRIDGIHVLIIENGHNEDIRSLYRAEMRVIPNTTLLHLRKGNASMARNIGLNHSTTDWVWFFDDDDVVCESTVEAVLQYVSQCNDTNALILPMRTIFGNRAIKEQFPSKKTNSFEYIRKYGHSTNTSCVILKRELVIKCGGWDESLAAGQDTDLFLRLSENNWRPDSIYCEPVSVFIDTPNRITEQVWRQQFGKLQFLKKKLV